MDIVLDSVSRLYVSGEQRLAALDNVSASIRAGEYVALVGASGSGKTTLMNILGCLDVPTSGHYSLQGKRTDELSDAELTWERNRTIGFVFQSFHLIARASLLENVEQPLVFRRMPRAIRQQRAMEALARVGLADRAKDPPTRLSGGQRQRVAIARATVTEPRILLADEPTGNLDLRSTAGILDIFDQLHQSGHTIVMVTHDLEVARRSDRLLRLADGRLIEDAAVGTLDPARKDGADRNSYAQH